MKALVLQLSDLHLTGQSDAVLGRADKLADAVRSIDWQPDLCVIAISGDIAYSGSQDQYLVAVDLVSNLAGRLAAEVPGTPRVHVVVVPGNHDCDFELKMPARALLVEALAKAAQTVTDDIVAECTGIQEAFFQFRNLVDEPISKGDNLSYSYSFGDADDRMYFHCYNSAWASHLRETPGTLTFPTDRVVSAPDAAVVISMIHHPYNWFQPTNSRELRKRLEASSDIILTGHEHDFTRRAQAGEHGERNLYVEGGALQRADCPDESAFNVILLDTKRAQQRVLHFEWNESLYSEGDGKPDWEEYQVNRLRIRRDFEPSEQTWKMLADLGITIHHPTHGDLALDDIFVFPDLREVTYRVGDQPRSLRGEHLLEEAMAQGRLLITGDDRSGKTSLARVMFRGFLELGVVPLLIDGSSVRLETGDRLDAVIAQAFRDQYSHGSLEEFRQLPRDRRVLLVDNYHRIGPRSGTLRTVIAQMALFADCVVLFSNDIAQQLADIVGLGPRSLEGRPFAHFRIQYYGHVRRKQLAERWFALDPSVAEDGALFARKLMEVKTMMDTAIGRNFVPALPVYILAILQAEEYRQQVDVNASTYGYFYELLIRSQLAKGSTHEGYDIKMGYLTFLASSMFMRGVTELSDQDFRVIHAQYEEEFALPLGYSPMQADLLKCHILYAVGDTFGFKYSYIYYYFVARHLSQHITEGAVSDVVRALAGSIHEEQSANVLLFLAHLSKDSVIVESLLARAAEIFASTTPADLTVASSPLPDVERSLRDLIYVNKPAIESQTEILEELDAAAADDSQQAVVSTRQADEEALAAFRAVIVRYSVAFRTLQILGQVVKNFPGTMRGTQKRQIIEACFSLGLRTLGSLFDTIRFNADDLIKDVEESLRSRNRNLSPDELVKRARSSILGLAHLATYGVIKRISQAVGSRALSPVYSLIVEEWKTPAADLIDFSLTLDQFSEHFPTAELMQLSEALDGNVLAFQALRNLVFGHLHLFEVDLADKQRVCAKLMISLKQVQRIDPRKRLLPGRRTRD